MPNFATIEDAPHHLKVLYDYGKTAVTLALGLLTLSVAFADKLLKPPVDGIQSVLLVLLWLSLFVALIAGLYIAAHITGASLEYMTAMRKAAPDDLQLISRGSRILQDPPLKMSEDERKEIDQSVKKSGKLITSAYTWANISFYMFALSSIAVALLGYYTLIYNANRVTASSSVDLSLRFVAEKFKRGKEARLSSVTYQEKDKTYAVVITDQRAPKEEYQLTVDAASGGVIKAARSPLPPAGK